MFRADDLESLAESARLVVVEVTEERSTLDTGLEHGTE
jgi:hypothetical protein